MGDTLVLVDADGDFYAFDAALLEAAATVTAAQVEAARLGEEAQAAVQMALQYERVGQACGPLTADGDEIVLADRPFTVLGSIGAR